VMRMITIMMTMMMTMSSGNARISTSKRCTRYAVVPNQSNDDYDDDFFVW
jgi:hypothetical protein